MVEYSVDRQCIFTSCYFECNRRSTLKERPLNDKFLIAGVTVSIVLLTFTVAYGLNALGQWKSTKAYVPPSDLVDIIKIVIGASMSTLTLAGLIGSRNGLERKIGEHDDSDKKK